MKKSIKNKSTSAHPLNRFVSREALALHLGLKSDEIYKISCWRYVIHVVGKGKSRFVSYADMPPITGVKPPVKSDFGKWRKRIKARKQKYVPKFWAQFYVKKIEETNSLQALMSWENLVMQCRSLMSIECTQKIDLAVSQKKSRFEKVS